MNMQHKTILIDGSQGEGGGQILRTALSLSMITGIPFELQNIRAGRKKPGLMRQHLVCVQASQRISNATVEGAALHSTHLHFAPQQVQAGQYEFQIGSAGSTMLVFQTLLPALMMQDQPSQLTIHGGTHNPMAPTADFVQQAFLPALQKMGAQVDFKLEKAGFFPVGGGKVSASIAAWLDRKHFSVLERGALQSLHAYAVALNIPQDIAQRELATLDKRLSLNHRAQLYPQGTSQGNTAFVVVASENHTQVVSALGEVKKSSEQVGTELAREVQAYLASQAVADEHLADQLLLPLALGKGGEFTAQVISEHTRTQAEMIQRFIDCEIEFIPQASGTTLIRLSV